MNLAKKKALARRTLGFGKKRIIFLNSRLDEIKEAITKRDILELHKDGAIVVKEIKGRKRKKKKPSRSVGHIRKIVKKRKKAYVNLTRKLRAYLSEMGEKKALSKEDVAELRKKIKNKDFKSKAQLKEFVGELKR